MAASSQRSTDVHNPADRLLPKDPHSAIICGQTGCSKTVFILDLLEGPYTGVFQHVVILYPMVRHNKTYKVRPWIWSDRKVYIVDPGALLHDYLRGFFHPVLRTAHPVHHR